MNNHIFGVDSTPEDTATSMYIAMSQRERPIDFVDLQVLILEKWPTVSLYDVGIGVITDFSTEKYLHIYLKDNYREKNTKTMYYVTRLEHNPDRQTEYYMGYGQWETGISRTGWEKNNRLSLRLYENQELAKSVLKEITEGDWHGVEVQK